MKYWPYLIKTRLIAVQRLVWCNLLSGRLPLYIVTEYPKSGGTWLSQMLAGYLDIPYPRNQAPPLRSCVMHGHYLYNPRMRNVVCVVRDGRDIMVSYYFHNLIESRHNQVQVRRMRKRLPLGDFDRIEKNLPAFIEYMFTKGASSWSHFRWDQFVESWAGRGVPVVRYEDMLENAARVVYNALGQLTGRDPKIEEISAIVKQYSFEKQAKRPRGTEDKKSFLRKGIAGDWKTKFTKEACEVFDHYAGRTLVEMGYESSRKWVDEFVPVV